MYTPKTLAAAALIGVVSTFAALPALADATIHVLLWDNGPTAMDNLGDIPPMGMAMAGATDPAMAAKRSMGIEADQTTVSAGDITFDVANVSAETIHEMVVMPIADVTKPVPYYDETSMRIDEDAAGALGEVSELEPGSTGSVTLQLAAGTYMLVCNIPGHYAMGMWTLINVTN